MFEIHIFPMFMGLFSKLNKIFQLFMTKPSDLFFLNFLLLNLFSMLFKLFFLILNLLLNKSPNKEKNLPIHFNDIDNFLVNNFNFDYIQFLLRHSLDLNFLYLKDNFGKVWNLKNLKNHFGIILGLDSTVDLSYQNYYFD